MEKLFGPNWKTSVSGIGAALFSALTWISTVSYETSPLAAVIAPQYKPTVQYIAGVAAVALWIWNGLSQKDKNVTGGTIPQTVEAEKRSMSPEIK